jgi:hypothetical protein
MVTNSDNRNTGAEKQERRRSVVEKAAGGRLTPLWVIAGFISLTEIVISFSVVQTTGFVQILLTLFAIAFPTAVAGLFFYTLIFKPQVLYAPFDYSAAVDMERYVRVLHYARDPERTTKEIEEVVQKALLSETIAPELREIVRAATSLSAAETSKGVGKADAARLAARRTAKLIVSELSVRIDPRPLLGNKGDEFEMDVRSVPDLQTFLDYIFFYLNKKDPAIKPFQYNVQWVLEDAETGKKYDDIRGLGDSNFGDFRSLHDIGIEAGMRLLVKAPT